MTIQEVSKIAKENGFVPTSLGMEHAALLYPEFWKALGRGLGWKGDDYGVLKETMAGGLISCTYDLLSWRYYWHRLIDHLTEGGTIDSFFETL